MSIKVNIKICGISNEPSLKTAIDNGAAYIGFVHFPKSPRHVDLAEIRHLSEIAFEVSNSINLVVVLVDPSDELILSFNEINHITHIQLHGSESVDRIKQIKALTDKKIIKAIAVAHLDDLQGWEDYQEVCDNLMFDTKIVNSDLTGGHGVSFDWGLLEDIKPKNKWFLAGGINKDNIKQATENSSADVIDISSGVESARGVKDNHKIQEILNWF